MKVVLAVLAGLSLVGGALMFWAYQRTDTYLGRFLAWRSSDVGDMHRFASRPVAPAEAPRPFPRDTMDLASIQVSYQLSGAERVTDLPTLLSGSSTSAFLVISGGQLVGEWYDAGLTAETPVTSFSIAKSVTALLALAAVEDGYFGSLDDPITDYVPELLETDTDYGAVTLRHLLNMRSGVRFRDHDLPWGDKARVYYEPHLRELVTRLPLVSQPGGRFEYNSYNPVLVGLALERATGGEVATYLQERLWAPLGAEGAASWSTSRAGETLPKMESGLNARALDIARFGPLLAGALHDVLGPSSVAPVVELDPALAAPSEGEGVHYQLGWWHFAQGAGRPHSAAALGHLGQYLYVYPDLDVVVARFGESLGGVGSWRHVFDQVALAVSGRDD